MIERDRPHRIEQVRVFPVTIPSNAPILTPYGSLGNYARSLIELTTESGLISYTDLPARYTPEVLQPFLSPLRGMNIWESQLLKQRIKNWTYYPWVKPEPVMGALDIAFLDLQAKSIEEPLYRLLGGKVRDAVPICCYVFYRHANQDGDGEVKTPEDVVHFAKECVDKYGFEAIKLKGGYYSADHDLESMAALRDSFGPKMRLRIDPQGSWTPTTAIRIGRELAKLGIEYLEDPSWGASGMSTVARHLDVPLATNMCVTQFDDVAPAFSTNSIAVILSDLWYWGGIRATLSLDEMCGALGLEVGMHSATELGFGWAAMIHTASAMPHLISPIDYMNMHLVDDIIKGGKITPVDGCIPPPEGPGLGVEIDEQKLEKFKKYSESSESVDRFMTPSKADIARPGWFPRMPAW